HHRPSTPLQKVALAHLALAARNPSVVRPAFRNPDHFTIVVLDAQTDPVSVMGAEGFPPLAVAKGVRRPVRTAGAVRLVERLYVQPGELGYIRLTRNFQAECHA